MHYCKTLLACTALLFAAANLQAESIAPSGKNDRLEWKVKNEWQVDGKPLDIVHSLDHKLVFILNQDKQVLVYDNSGGLQGRIPVGPGVSAIDIAPQGEALYLINTESGKFTSVSLSYVVDIDVTGSPFKGKSDAPVTIALFTDFE